MVGRVRGIGHPRGSLPLGASVLPSFPISFNFVLNETLDPRITATGGAGGTRVNAAGNIVAQGAPRYDYDPVSKVIRGLLCEMASTNMALQSGAFGNAAGWARSSATFNIGVAVSPAGTNTGDRMVEAVGAGVHLCRQTITTVAATVYTASLYFKPDTRSNFMITLDDGTTAFATAKFNGTAISVNAVTGTGAVATIVDAGNGWMRVTLTGTAPGVTTRFTPTLLDAAFANSYTGDGVSGLFLWGGQFELGPFATSMIPTTTVAVGRTTDVLTITGTNFSSWFVQGDGSVSEQFMLPRLNLDPNAATMGRIDDSSAANIINLRQVVSIAGADLFIVTASATQVDTASGVVALMQPQGAAFAWSNASTNLAVAGVLVGADVTTFTNPLTYNRLVLSGAGGFGPTAWLRGWAYTPVRLSNADLMAVSASSVVPAPALAGFNPSFNIAPVMSYTLSDLLALRTDAAGFRAVRGLIGHTTGKFYVEVDIVGPAASRFVGVVDSTFNVNGAGAPAGVNRCGLQGTTIVASPAVSVPYVAAGPGSTVRFAWDATAKLFWVKVGASPWNGNALADPAAGIGGLSTGSLTGAGYLGATFNPVIGAGARYRLQTAVGYALPAGFSEMAS